MKLLMFIGITVGGGVGWWLGSAGGMGVAFLVSTVGSAAGVYGAYRLDRDYL